MNKLFATKDFLFYLIKAKSKYYVHSPFVFEFVNEVLNDTRSFYSYEEIESTRKLLSKDDSIIEVEDFGAGSQHEKKNKRTISFIAKTSSAPKNMRNCFSELLNIINAKTYWNSELHSV